jgi:hypothetical protein
MLTGKIVDAVGETWRRIDKALRKGSRGLPGGSSLARLLNAKRGVRNPADPPPLSRPLILCWADAYRERTGKWPVAGSGPIQEAPGETWSGVDAALMVGRRSLTGGSSLAQLLGEERGVRNRTNMQRLTIADVLSWADWHHQSTGSWPCLSTGPVINAPGEVWRAVDSYLRCGLRGLPGGISLAGLLAGERGSRNVTNRRRLTTAQILAWADSHQRRTGCWPNAKSGPIREAPEENWSAVVLALRVGCRGLPGGMTLANLLAEQRGVRNRMRLPRLTTKQIRAWAAAHEERTGARPTRQSGPVAGIPGQTWLGIDMALRHGRRGLRGGSSLSRLLGKRRRAGADAR